MKKTTNNSGKELKTSGKKETKKLKITSDNYNEIKTSLKRFLIIEIERYAIKSGNREKLSLVLGGSPKLVEMRLKRGSFSSLERLWRECIEKIKE